jgi:hypothetical protein
MKRIIKILVIALAAILLSIISFYFINGWYNLIPWGIVVMIIGYVSISRCDSIINGALFGYFLFLVYIFAGYKDKTDANRMLTFIPFDVFFSLVGAVAGGIGSFIGNWIGQKFARSE